ncbi:MAG: hypothetical protein OXH36_02800 [Bdellovibrionales bacterium]|nr:hypothetical protein [Bdellovibrionales bacterium]
MDQSLKLFIFSIGILFTSTLCAAQIIDNTMQDFITEMKIKIVGTETDTVRMPYQLTERRAPCNGAEGHYHPNGGGFVADTATVADTVFIEDSVEVCDKATIRDSVIVGGYTIVDGSALISGQTDIDHAHITDNADISGQAIISMVHVGCNVKISGDTTEIYGTMASIPCDMIITEGKWSFE